MPAAAAVMNSRSRNNNHHQWTLIAFVTISFCLVIPSFVILGILTNSPANEDKLFGPSTDVHFLIDQPRTEENLDTSRNNKHPTDNALSNNFNTSTNKKRIKRTYNQTSFPGFSKTITTVRCGGHSAPTCTECPNGNGAAWCNGECEWDYKTHECGRSSKLAHIHPDYFRIIQRYAFQPVVTNNGEYVNVVLVRAPFRDGGDEELYQYYKEEILFLGISSFESFPLRSPNPYSAKYESSYYLNMFPGFLHMMHQPSDHFPPNVKTLLMSQSDFNLEEPYFFGRQQQAQKEEILYDFVYSGGDQDVETDCVGWASYNKNFSFVREALEVMCSDEFNVTGVLVANKNKANTKACTIPSSCDDKIVQTTFLDQRQFFTYLSQARWAFLPQICDASPRVSTQALSMNKPLLMNRNIMGGWKYLLPGVTGEEFNDIHDFRAQLRKILDNTRGKNNPYEPLEFVRENYGNPVAGVRLLEYVKSHWGDRVDLPDGTKFLVPTGA
mmetsp:Transcript_27363/g.42126  ORF Transcript_27363/g.42126 Transcript_27363/m.42126 type:complete len:497 (-) Transcript_27363:1448-2938(-)